MKKNLRDYQQDVLELIRDEIRNGNKRILVFACTGFGKTILSKTIAENSVKNGKRVLFTNHRIQLSGQSANVFSEINPNIIQGKNTTDNGSLLTVATIQSLYQKEPFDVVIIDEVHYAYESKLIQRILNANPNAIIIGLSATPFDENGCIIDGFNAVIDKYQTEDLIKLGYLTPFNCFAPINLSFTDNLDVEIQSVLDGYLKESNGKKFVGFGRSIEHCHQLKEAFRLSGTKCEVIDQSVNDKTRDKYLKQLKDNQLMGLFSVEILTTGFDEPSIECVIFACLASSIKKYIQCAGRGIRMIEGKKECILLDFYGNIELHGMPDQRLKIIKKTKISKVIDRILKLDVVSNEAEKIEKEISESKMIFLKSVGSILDLYDGKYYKLESEFQDDVNNFIKKTGFFNWRQNSGKANIQGRWIHFASKAGLPDNTVFYKNSSFYFGLELKLPTGRLTDKQKETLPEMVNHKVLFFICENILDVFNAISHVEKHVIQLGGSTVIIDEIYSLYDREIELRKKLKIPLYL